MEYIKLKSRAKINLTLDVTAKRDDGYHDLEMIMQTVSLYDSIFIKKAEKDGIVIKTNLYYLPTDERNITYKAAKLIKEEFGIHEGVYIELTKRIPVAAGLAGGSGNCAAVIKGMNRLFGLNLSMQKMMELGARLGSDVPYCLMEGTALAQGRGEVLTRLAPCPHFYVLLAKPDISVSTAYVYTNLKLDRVKNHPDTKAVLTAIANGDKMGISLGLCNVLENVTIPYKPIVGDIKKFIEKQGALGVLMSGSGPTVFAIFDKKETAKEAAKNVKGKFKIKDVYVTEIYNSTGEKGRN
ncbi:MAG: 4-(cytidine 5'-diphospho)-2-C-methyl-D-erythritol kinase [Anaerotignaceae bacterium]